MNRLSITPCLRFLTGLVFATAMCHGTSLAAQTLCRQALSIGLDISGSVDQEEYRIQMDGLADALLDDDVVMSFLAMPDAIVTLHVYEWAGVGTQRTLVSWLDINRKDDLEIAAGILKGQERRPREVPTALGLALAFGANEIAQRADCWRHTLDIVADGISNAGPRPRDLMASLTKSGMTINALIIGEGPPDFLPDSMSEVSHLRRYFESEVIHGPDAFVEEARGYKDFQAAMTRKLLKELQTLILGRVVPVAVDGG